MLVMLKKARKVRDRKRCTRKNAKHRAKNKIRHQRLAK